MHGAREASATPRAPRRHWWLGLVAALLLVSAACGSAENFDDDPSLSVTDLTPVARVPLAPTATATGDAFAAAAATTTTPQPTRTATRPSGPTATPTPIPSPIAAIGTAVTSPGWRITVTAIDYFQRVGDAAAQGTYLYVELTVENVGSAPAAFPYDGLVVLDQAERSFTPDLDATRETLTFDKQVDIAAQLQPRAPANVAVVFDIPPDATSLVLTTPTRVFSIRLEFGTTPK